MKNAKSLLAALIFLGSMTASVTAFAADGVIAKDELAADSYCHQKFPAIGDRSLASDDPMLKSQGSGDVIDFYGSCAEDPTGNDAVQSQKLDYQHQWARDYED